MKTLVLGAGRSGLAVARYLLKHGKEVIVSDQRERAQVEQSPTGDGLRELEQAHPGKIEWAFGGHPVSLLERCDEVVISPGVSLHVPFLQTALARGVRVTGEMELAFSACPKPIISVTGTNGKSTTCSLLGDMLGESGVVGGNIGIPLLDQVQELDPQVEWVVAEVSSFQMETVHKFKPRIGILTNITPDHLDHHKDLEEYEIAKSRMFAQMTDECTAIFCADDGNAMRMCQQLRNKALPHWIPGFPVPLNQHVPKILNYSARQSVRDGMAFTNDDNGGRWVTRYEEGMPEQLFLWDAPGLPGNAMMSNGLAAVTAALEAGVSLEKIQAALRRFQPLHYRMEHAGEVGGITYVNDSKATNIDSALASVTSVKGPLAVIVGGKDKGVDYGSLAQGLASRNGRVFLIGEASGPIQGRLEKLEFENYQMSGNIQAALEQATEYLKGTGGTVLLAPACSSFDQFKSAEHRGEVFNELVAELMKTRSGKS